MTRPAPRQGARHFHERPRPRRFALDTGRPRPDVRRYNQRRLQHLVAAIGRREACTVDRLQDRPNLLVRLLARWPSTRALPGDTDERRDPDPGLSLGRGGRDKYVVGRYEIHSKVGEGGMGGPAFG